MRASPLFLLLAGSLASCVGLHQCDGDGAAGEPCGSGKDCASGVCISGVQCDDGKTINVCASSRCDDGCTDGEACARPLGLSHSYCYPLSACDRDAGVADVGEQPIDGSP